MKKIHLFSVLLLVLSVSCKESSKIVTPTTPIDNNALLQEEVNNHPSINAPIVEQSKVKHIDVFLNKRLVSTLDYAYFPDGKIKNIAFGNANSYEYVYKDDIVIANNINKSYKLDRNGLAQSIIDDSQTKFFYKDGFLIRTNIAGDFKYNYSTNGNLIKASIGYESLNYEYTEYPNTIRQEILKLQEYSNSIRDLYLGRYSTNLIKTIKYNDKTVMTFDYEFDAQKRVTKVTMNRTSEDAFQVLSKIIIGPPILIEYNLSY